MKSLATVCSAIAFLSAVALSPEAMAHGGAGDETVTQIAQATLPPVANSKATALRVDFPPGAVSKPHTHPGHVFVVVLSGEIETAVGDQPPQRYKAGEAWYEAPGEVHTISRNPSATEPATVIAWLLSDGNEQLVAPVQKN